jgi:hypothetical protein
MHERGSIHRRREMMSSDPVGVPVCEAPAADDRRIMSRFEVGREGRRSSSCSVQSALDI